MDLVVLDTETTGLEVSRAIGLSNWVACSVKPKHTETRFHHYINPGRAIDAEARGAWNTLRINPLQRSWASF